MSIATIRLYGTALAKRRDRRRSMRRAARAVNRKDSHL
ncbi:MAG: hypothetical protein JWN39_873, partial [Ilumatobacteraceae bacterium]|nr:hypothetical protein [Ilumatobacteraceae bacterium]